MRFDSLPKPGRTAVKDKTMHPTAHKKRKYKKCLVKFGLLALLTVQNAVHVIAMRYVRVRPQPMFLPTVAVFFAELIKLLTCLMLIIIDQRSIVKSLQLMRKQILQQPLDTLKVCVPALLYVIVGVLMFTAISNLTAATFMVLALSLILFSSGTGYCHIRRLSVMQWLSLPVLLAGIVLVQMDEKNTERSARERNMQQIDNNNDTADPLMSASVLRLSTTAAYDHVSNQKPLLGFAAVLVICLLSGFAGVYLEKILKNKKDVSLWIRNIQLCIVSLPVSLISIFVKDGKLVQEQGFTVGFDTAVWLTVFLAAFGGLIVAVIIKYTDNILKAFATSFAVILSCIFSAVLFHFQPTLMFLIGAVLVIAAVCVYSIFPYKSTSKPASAAAEAAVAVSATAAALQSVSLIDDEKRQLQSI